MDDLHFQSIETLSDALAQRRITSAALTRLYLDRIERLNPVLNAYNQVYADAALALAKASDQRRSAGYRLGPLDGIPVAIKDLCGIEDQVMTAGSKAWQNKKSPVTATAVHKLLEAGAVILGKTHMVEFAFGGWGTNPLLGTPRNPWDTKQHRIPGGSSSGSGVAVAAGLTTAAIGSDTGGSVRIPATLNGITGMKTTAGLISLHGCADLSTTLDSLGPMTRSARDAELLTRLLAGHDPNDARTFGTPAYKPAHRSKQINNAPLRGVVIGLIPAHAYPMPIRPDVQHTLDSAAETFSKLGATLITPEFPFDFHNMMLLNGQIIAAEAYALHRSYIHDDSQPFGSWVRQRILSGQKITSADYIDALKAHAQARHAWSAWMADKDALLVPGSPIAACTLAEVDESTTPLAAFTRPGNFLGACALALPAGFDASGLPLGVQLYGKAFHDSAILELGHLFQEATDWHLKTPDL